MILNSRPLSFVSSEDLDEPLTPSHLLTGRRLLFLPDPPLGVDPDYGETSVELSLRARYLTLFWQRWKRAYLLELREQHRRSRKNVVGDGKVEAVGDIIVICDQGLLRGFGRLAVLMN